LLALVKKSPIFLGVHLMNRPIWGTVFPAFAVAIALAGCSDSGQKGTTSDKTTADATATAAGSPTGQAGDGILSHNIAKRSSIEGRWVLVFYQRLKEFELPAALIDISKKNGKLTGKIMSYGTAISNSSPTLKGATVTPQALHLLLDMTVGTMMPGQQQPVQQTKQADILVEFHDGYARGTAQFSPVDNFLVAMVPTQLEQIQEIHPQRLPEANELSEFKDKREEFLNRADIFVKAHPDSPLTMDVYPALFMTAQERKLDKAAVDKLSDEYVKTAQLWGSRAAFKARIDIASALVKSNYLHETAIHQIDLALGQLTEETIPIWRTVLEQMKETARDNETLGLAHNGTPEQRDKAIPILRERTKKFPYDPIVLVELARYDESHGKLSDALKTYAKLAVLPMFDEILRQLWTAEKANNPSPRESAEKLWKSQHGGKTDGFEKYLDDVYAESMPKFGGKQVEPRPADPENRVVLCELFTGVACGPCVAADVAFAYLLKSFAPSEVIALQYHEDVAGPDPLANQDSEARFRYYFPDRGGTPTFVIDGMPQHGGGYLHQTGEVYQAVRGTINQFLSRKTSVRIQLAAQPKGSVVGVTADAEGSFAQNEPIRLRIALAEERVFMRGLNGVREHEMVVRTFLGGPQGAELKDGKLHYEGSVDLKAIRVQLNDQLSAEEESHKIKFPAKPLELAHLKLVAFVQNDQSREIYQAKLLPFPSSATPSAAQAQPASARPQQAVAHDGKNP
jgi:hypothetical protein